MFGKCESNRGKLHLRDGTPFCLTFHHFNHLVNVALISTVGAFNNLLESLTRCRGNLVQGIHTFVLHLVHFQEWITAAFNRTLNGHLRSERHLENVAGRHRVQVAF